MLEQVHDLQIKTNIAGLVLVFKTTLFYVVFVTSLL